MSLLWKVDTDGTVCSSAAVVDGKLYIGVGCSDQRTVLCLDVDTGFVLWNQTVGGVMCSSPAVEGGKVYIGTKYQAVGTYSTPGVAGVYCLDAETGAILWNYTVGAGNSQTDLVSSPTVADGRVFIGGYCFDANTGELLWQYPNDTRWGWNSAPAVVDGRVYVGADDGNVTCLDAITGDVIWSYTTDGPVWSSPAVVDGKVFVGTEGNATAYCLDAATGNEIWKITLAENVSIWSSAAVAYGNVYVGTENDGKLYCLDENTGGIKWVNDTGRRIHDSSPAVADGKVYVGASGGAPSGPDGWVCCFDAYTGNLLWKYTTAPYGYISSSPVVAYGMIFVGSDESIVALGAPAVPTAHVSIENASRGDLIVDVGVGDPTFPEWCRRIWNGEGGNAQNLELTVDLSDAAAYLPPSDNTKWFLRVYDDASGGQGFIREFNITWGSTSYASTDVPVPISDFQTSYAYVSVMTTNNTRMLVGGVDDRTDYRTLGATGVGAVTVLGSTSGSPVAAMLGEPHIVVTIQIVFPVAFLGLSAFFESIFSALVCFLLRLSRWFRCLFQSRRGLACPSYL
jgi:outer membrane protein assembly factor BamB